MSVRRGPISVWTPSASTCLEPTTAHVNQATVRTAMIPRNAMVSEHTIILRSLHTRAIATITISSSWTKEFIVEKHHSFLGP